MIDSFIALLTHAIDFFLHLDVHLAALSAAYGPWIYLILFMIIFAETGLVVTPFLPGDSLLFAAGAMAAVEGSGLEIGKLWCLLVFAAFVGDNTNYSIGNYVGPKAFAMGRRWYLNPEYLQKAKVFYDRHGAKTIFFARFLPIFRTFVPFLAGVAQMRRSSFVIFSLSGTLVWISTFLGAGFFFGGAPAIKGNFHIVIFSVILISALPAIVGFFRARQSSKKISLS